MRKELNAISAVSMAISFLAAIVLCMQLAQAKVISGWQPDGLMLWGLEIAVFGVAACLWRQDVSLGGWSLGIAGLLLVRTAITVTAALALSFAGGAFLFDKAMAPVSAFLPRACATFFALMICYPLRVFLPGRAARPKQGESSPGAEVGKRQDTTTWFAAREEQPTVTLASEQSEWQSFAPVIAEEQFTGVVEVPLRAVLEGVPDEHLTAEASQYDAGFPVALPLALIGPQLKEGLLLLRLADLRVALPPGVLTEAPDLEAVGGEPVLVSLPLEEVVPVLPPEALELPSPSPPAWAGFPDPESVVFAVV